MPAILSGLALLGGGDSGDGDGVALGTFVAGQLFVWLFLLGAPLLASYRRGQRDLGADFGFRARWGDVPVGLALGVLTQLAIYVVYLPLFRLFDDLDSDDVERVARRVLDDTTGAEMAVLFVAIVVVAPVVEELFFRGLVLRYLRRHLGDAAAVVGSAALFAVSHLQLVTIPALTLFGIVAAVLALRTGRLGPSIFLHVAFNGFTFAALAGSG